VLWVTFAKLRVGCENRRVSTSTDVSGSLYGSSTGLSIALLLPIWCILVPPAATGVVKWVLPIGCTFGILLLAPIMRRSSILTITDDGMALVQFGKSVYIPWENVASIKSGTFGASLVLKESQRIGARQRRTFPFAGFNLNWRTRPTSYAVQRKVARSKR
jgi:hypothetical protein